MTVRLSRRDFAGLFIGSAFLAACGGSKTGSIGSSAVTSKPAPSGVLPPVTVRGATVPVADQITIADAKRYVPLFGGRWLGAWHDSTGASGTSDVSARVNALRRSVGITVAATGNLLTAPVAPESYTLNLAGYSRDAASWRAQSPQVGDIVLTGEGGTDFTATITTVPQPSIHSIDVQATRAGGRVDLAYTLNLVNGSPIHGAMAWAKGTTRATPGPIGGGSAATPVTIQSGTFAAGLLTASDLSKATGTRFGAPVANGGRLLYDHGVNVSNGTAKSVDQKLDVQYSVFICDSSADANAFWHKESAQHLPPVAGPWRSGFFQTTIPTMYAFTGRYVVTVQIVNLAGTTSDQRSAAIAVAKALVRNLPAK
jgi:hypothetical protein